jgi:hypothetical protein
MPRALVGILKSMVLDGFLGNRYKQNKNRLPGFGGISAVCLPVSVFPGLSAVVLEYN